MIGVGPLEAPQKTGIAGLLLLSFSNLLIFGQDLVMYVGTLPRGPLFFTANIHNTMPQLWTFLFIPPAWSLSVELAFYVIAPFLVRRASGFILGLMALSLALRALLFFKLHLTNDPWTGRFFPTEILFFLAGVLAYRIYRRVQLHELAKRFWPMIVVAFFGCFLAYQFVPEWSIAGLPIKQAVYYPLAWLVIPFAFASSRKSKIDRYIGELSFPLYLVHYPMLRLLLMVLHHFRLDSLLAPIGIFLSLAASIVLLRVVTLPLEKLRQRRVQPVIESRPNPDAITVSGDGTRRQTPVSRYNGRRGFAAAGTNASQSR